MPKVAIYTRATTGGSRRRYVKATKGSTGPFFLRYEVNGKRVWEGIHTRTYTFALADARSKESLLLRNDALPPKPSPAAPRKLSGQREERFWLHKFRDTFATWALRRGVDIRTVQYWLGHASRGMTQRYLAPDRVSTHRTKLTERSGISRTRRLVVLPDLQ